MILLLNFNLRNYKLNIKFKYLNEIKKHEINKNKKAIKINKIY